MACSRVVHTVPDNEASLLELSPMPSQPKRNVLYGLIRRVPNLDHVSCSELKKCASCTPVTPSHPTGACKCVVMPKHPGNLVDTTTTLCSPKPRHHPSHPETFGVVMALTTKHPTRTSEAVRKCREVRPGVSPVKYRQR